MKHSEPLLARLDRFQQRGLIVGAVGILASIVGLIVDSDQFFRSWLFGYIFWVGIALGAFSIYMLHNMVGGAWGFLIRRLLSSAMRTLPLMLILFIPIGFGLPELFPWARASAQEVHIIHAKAGYLNVPFFLIRTLLYFGIWIGWALLVFGQVRRLEETGNVEQIRKIQNYSAIGLLLLVLTVTFASVDWLMSLEPEWFSTIFGLQTLVGFALAAISAATILLIFLSRYSPISGLIRPKILHDLGNLMFAFNMLWAYISFSQLLIIYAGNIAEETPWYLHRLHGGWEFVAYSLIALHFVTPFLILLSRRNKRNTRMLTGVAFFLLIMRLVDTHWVIMPSFFQADFHVHWLDLATVLGIGGAFVWMFFFQLKRRPLLLVNDPRMKASLAHVEEAEPIVRVSEEELATADKNGH